MTLDEMRDAINTAYAQHLGKPLADAVPDGVTAQAWHVVFAPDLAQLEPEQFVPRCAEPVGMGLAAAARALGLQKFARVEVQDRPALTVKGSRSVRKRDREYIAIALGW